MREYLTKKVLILFPILLLILSFSFGCSYLAPLFGQLYDCDDEIQFESKSPDNKYVATVFVRNCGATTSFVTHVKIRTSDKSFIGSSDNGYAFETKDRPEILLNWENERQLTIKCKTCPDQDAFGSTHGTKTLFGEVEVRY